MDFKSSDDNLVNDNLTEIDIDNLAVKVSSLKFHKTVEKFNSTSRASIIFQRIRSWKYFLILCSCMISKYNQSTKGEEDDIERGTINIERGVILTKEHLAKFFGTQEDSNSGAVMDSSELENVKILTDVIFRQTCMDASTTCHQYARGFLFMEIITKIADLSFAIFYCIPEFLGFSPNDFIIATIILVPIIVIQVATDWGKLLEKYSRLYFEFSTLANSRDENRIKDYEHLVNQFRSSWIYGDLISLRNK